MTGQAESVAQDILRSFFERWRRLEEDKAAISDDLKELFAEAKGTGFDTKVMRKVFRDNTADASERADFEAVYDLYAAALGMSSAPREAVTRDPRVRTREIIEEFGDEDAADEAVPPAPHEPAPPAANGPEVAADQGGEGGGALSAEPIPAVVEGSRPTRGTDVGDGGDISRPLGTTTLTTSADAGTTSLPAEGDADRHTVLMQEGGVKGEGQAGAAREHGGGEPSQPLLPSDRVENKPDGPAVIAAVPNPNCRGLQPGGCSFTHHKFGVACSPCNNAAMRERMEARAGKHQRVDA